MLWLKTQTLLENKNLSGHQGFHEEYQMCLTVFEDRFGFLWKTTGLRSKSGARSYLANS